MFSIKKDGHRSDYTCISNVLLRDKRLSMTAKGFMIVVLSLPDNWNFSVRGMAAVCGISEESVRRCLRELEQYGYAAVEQTRSAEGRFASVSYRFTEVPSVQEPHTEPPSAETPISELPFAEKAPQSNNNRSNKKERENIRSIKQADCMQEVFSFSGEQINARSLSLDYGKDYINYIVNLINRFVKNVGCKKLNGDTVDDELLAAVYSRATEADIRYTIMAMEGKRVNNFEAYFATVLYEHIKSRTERREPVRAYSSLPDTDELMADIMEKYRA